MGKSVFSWLSIRVALSLEKVTEAFCLNLVATAHLHPQPLVSSCIDNISFEYFLQEHEPLAGGGGMRGGGWGPDTPFSFLLVLKALELNSRPPGNDRI